VRVVSGVGIALLTRGFLSSALDPLLSTVLWLPLVATLLVLLVWRTPHGLVARGVWSGLDTLARDGLVFSAERSE
jgi:hypothetical protein